MSPLELLHHQIKHLDLCNPVQAKTALLQHLQTFLEQMHLHPVMQATLLERLARCDDLHTTNDPRTVFGVLHQCLTEVEINAYQRLQQAPLSAFLNPDLLDQLQQIDMAQDNAPYHLYAIVQDVSCLNAHGLDLGSYLNIMDWSRYRDEPATTALQHWIRQTIQHHIAQARKEYSDVQLVATFINEHPEYADKVADENLCVATTDNHRET